MVRYYFLFGPKPVATEPLRSRLSEPATVVPPPLVAVTAEGKLYHDPNCAFIHGPVRVASSAQAIAEGFTPCPRCVKP